MLPPEDAATFLQKNFHFAVVEVGNDALNLGFQMYSTLKSSGYMVSAVNLHERIVQGETAFPTISDVRPVPDVIVFTILEREDPHRGMNTLKEMRDHGIFRMWAEPDCASFAMREFAAANAIDLLASFSLAAELAKQVSA